MTSSNRTDVLKRLYTELKKKYTVTAPVERTVLEYFIFATCLEDATYEAAENAFAALVHTMSGWNEVRVSSVAELAELMPQLPDPRGAAVKIRRILHAIFEERYSFDIDDIRKKNIKEAYEKLESIPGGTPFSINYTAQVAFGRHGIPVGNGEKRLLYVLGVIDEEEVNEREVTGLNRAITKSQGIEFSSLLHKLAAAFVQNPESRKIISFLKAFASDFRTRMPRRREVRVENTMETPEPVVEHEVPRKTVMEMIINDPDFRKEREEDAFEDEYAEPEETTQDDFVEEPSRNRKKQKPSRKGGSDSSSEAAVKTSEKVGKSEEKSGKPEKTEKQEKQEKDSVSRSAKKTSEKSVEKPIEKVAEKSEKKFASAGKKVSSKNTEKEAEKSAVSEKNGAAKSDKPAKKSKK